MRIEVVKYIWADSIEDNDVNLFSGEAYTAQGPVDFYNFLIKDSFDSINYEFTDIDDNDNAIFMKASNLNFQCFNETFSYSQLSTDVTVTEWFELFTENHYSKWKVIIYDDDDVEIYRGMIYKDGVSMPDVQNQIVEFQCVGIEKEFEMYYSNQTLLGTDFLGSVRPVGTLNLDGLQYFEMAHVIRTNFDNVQFELPDYINDWYILSRPYIYYPEYAYQTNTLILRCGYDSFVLNNTDRYQFLNSLCLALGWKWFFKEEKLYIVKNYDGELDLLEIDYNETAITHSLSASLNQYQIENLIMPDGYYHSSEDADGAYTLIINSNQDGEQYIGGRRNVIYSETQDFFNNQSPFSRLDYQATITGTYSYVFDDYFTTFEVEEWERTKRERKFEMYLNGINTYDTTDRFLNYSKNNTAFINPIVSSDNYSGVLDMTEARTTNNTFYGNGNAYQINHEVGSNGFRYAGNIGHCAVKKEERIFGDVYLTYSEYIKGQEFNLNCRKYLTKNSVLHTEWELFTTITNPLQNISISNYPFADIDGVVFSIAKLSFNPISRITNLTLVA